MKNKTLALITAALITAAALILTASLSLLDSSADTISAVVSSAEGGYNAANCDDCYTFLPVAGLLSLQ